MYTKMNCSKNLDRKIRRMGQIWQRVAIVLILIAGVYTAVLLGNMLVQNMRLEKYMAYCL